MGNYSQAEEAQVEKIWLQHVKIGVAKSDFCLAAWKSIYFLHYCSMITKYFITSFHYAVHFLLFRIRSNKINKVWLLLTNVV